MLNKNKPTPPTGGLNLNALNTTIWSNNLNILKTLYEALSAYITTG
jgi:hypothetical protein